MEVILEKKKDKIKSQCAFWVSLDSYSLEEEIVEENINLCLITRENHVAHLRKKVCGSTYDEVLHICAKLHGTFEHVKRNTPY